MSRATYGRAGGKINAPLRQHVAHLDLTVKMMSEKLPRILLCAIPNLLKITMIDNEGKQYFFSKQMSATAMRSLAINLLQAADESERGFSYMKK
jgi:hypothetical protein